ncbi:MAG: hypothetical protein Q7R64_02125 [bacterium]|nr:hypothetical protein [bacterium]
MLLLLGGLSLGLSGSPRTSWKILGSLTKEWKGLGRQNSERVINSLYRSKLVALQENKDGTLTLTLTDNGKRRALTYDLMRMKIKDPSVWDESWRLISFDIPESKKPARDSIRGHLLRLGFYELHDSVFIHPFNCFKEVDYISELYDVRKHLCFMLVTYTDRAHDLKKFFNLN